MKMNKYTIGLVSGKEIEFWGRYRRDLETDNWHYYEKDDGIVMHFRKERLEFVDGDTVESIKENR